MPIPIKMLPKPDASRNEICVSRNSDKNRVRASSRSRSRENLKSDKNYSITDSFGEGRSERMTGDPLCRMRSSDSQRRINTAGRGNRRVNRDQVQYREQTGETGNRSRRSAMPRKEEGLNSWREDERKRKGSDVQVDVSLRQDKTGKKQEKDNNFKLKREDTNCQEKGKAPLKEHADKAKMDFQGSLPNSSAADKSEANSGGSFLLKLGISKHPCIQGENMQRIRHPIHRAPPGFDGEKVQSKNQKEPRSIVSAGSMCTGSAPRQVSGKQHGGKHNERRQSQQDSSRGNAPFKSKRSPKKCRNFQASCEKKRPDANSSLSEIARETGQTNDISNDSGKIFKAENGKDLRMNDSPDTKSNNRYVTNVVKDFPPLKADRTSSNVVNNEDIETMQGTNRNHPIRRASPAFENGKLAEKVQGGNRKARVVSKKGAQTTQGNTSVAKSTTTKYRVPPGFEPVTSCAVKERHSEDVC